MGVGGYLEILLMIGYFWVDKGVYTPYAGYKSKGQAKGKKMNTIDIAGKTYTVKGELPNGAFYLEGPRGGSVVFAKPIADNLYSFNPAKASGSIKDARGFAITATREQLAA